MAEPSGCSSNRIQYSIWKGMDNISLHLSCGGDSLPSTTKQQLSKTDLLYRWRQTPAVKTLISVH